MVAATALRAAAEEGGSDAERLLRAWEPFAVGHKGVWWEVVARPSDVEVDDEAAFRQQLRDLATESAALLAQALPEIAVRGRLGVVRARVQPPPHVPTGPSTSWLARRARCAARPRAPETATGLRLSQEGSLRWNSTRHDVWSWEPPPPLRRCPSGFAHLPRTRQLLYCESSSLSLTSVHAYMTTW